jgi:hypothetical protein
MKAALRRLAPHEAGRGSREDSLARGSKSDVQRSSEFDIMNGTKKILGAAALVLALTVVFSGAAPAQWFGGYYNSGHCGSGWGFSGGYFAPSYTPYYVPHYSPCYVPSYQPCYPVYRRRCW